ncbi:MULTISPECIES: glycosyltransferase [unclassified Flavobacterium]|uniref:glycosyltransferase n=1 Tax=unclassified Flavobacterium TaxID=196869 RepID=UPI001F145054|nr:MULTISPECIES: glycosyltransferase [unclassified Flavobacterium]UMY65835.1 glycosyltransferase [Flavobacterium sp. HJ-32-4]
MEKEPKKARICIVAPSRKMGGIERALSVLANYFDDEGYEVYYISCLKGQPFYRMNTGIHVREPQKTRSSSIVNKLTFYPFLLRFIRRNVRDIRPDVILTFGDFFNPLVLLAVKGLGIPTYISDRTSPDYNFPAAVQFGKKWLYPQSAGFIAQTRRAADYKIRQFGDRLRIRIIPNAIRDVVVSDVPKVPSILYVGRFAWEKGPERLIRAFARISERGNWKLTMAGDGPLWEKMKQLAVELKVDSSIEFLGKVEDVDALMSSSSIYVIPSVLEGFPNALCEAMAAGLPCLCFDSIPFEDILEPDESGIVIPDGDLDAMALRLQELMADPEKRVRMGEKAKENAKRRKKEAIGAEFLNFMGI